jgi:uracil-DNA glycosylase
MHKPKTISSSPVVCFVGISNKPGPAGTIEALSKETLSGKIVSDIETRLRSDPECRIFFRDNLVQSPPLQRGKLRYPTQHEMKSEWLSFQRRLRRTKSNVVILLGELVADFFRSKQDLRVVDCPFADGRLLKWTGIDGTGRIVLAIAHPSYVGIYARKHLKDYADAVFHAVQAFLQGSLGLNE